MDSGSSSKERASSTVDDRDVVELKKAMATGSAKEQPVASAAVSSIICYCFASILMTLVNKYVVSGANFSMNFLLLCIQSSVCCICVTIVKRLKIISFREFDLQDAKAWFPISFLLVSVIYTGSKSLQFLSIPVYTIFKNLTIILIAYGEVLWFGGRVTNLTLLSFFFMVLSSVVAAGSDMSNSSGLVAGDSGLPQVSSMLENLNVGYIWMMINCATSAAYVLAMRKRIKATGFSDWDSMFYNNLLSIPVLAVFSILAEDWGVENLSRNFPAETRSVLLFAIAFSGAAAVGISYTTAWCVRVTSSTTYSMVGALNKLPIAASGMLFFGDIASFGSVSAVGIGFCAGLVYAVAKNNQKKQDTARAQTDNILPLSHRKP